MKQFYLILLILLSFSSSASAEMHRGYIITHNGKALTGTIGSIYFSDYSSEVLFINDFGTPYRFRAELIKAFAFVKEGKTIVYESKYDKRRCVFLRVIVKGEGLNLYQSPVEQIAFVQEGQRFVRKEVYRNKEYWISQEGNHRAIKLRRFGFKRKMRRIIGNHAPELAKKIGKRGYRFKNLQEIIEKYNALMRRGVRTI